MLERKPKLLGGLLTLSLTLTSCGQEYIPPVGELLDKEFQPESTWTLPNGVTVIDDQDHILRINYCGEGDTEECRSIEFFAQPELFNALQPGEFVDLKRKHVVRTDPLHFIQK